MEKQSFLQVPELSTSEDGEWASVAPGMSGGAGGPPATAEGAAVPRLAWGAGRLGVETGAAQPRGVHVDGGEPEGFPVDAVR